MKIRVFGQRNSAGVGVHYANFCNSLARYHVIRQYLEEVDSSQPEAVQRASDSSADDDINIIFWVNHRQLKLRGWIIRWAVFESDHLPESYISLLRNPAFIIWVPSAWGKDVLVKHGLTPQQIDVVPEGVDPASYHPFLRTVRNNTPTPLKFLMIGKYAERKGYAQLFESFRRAFGNSTDVQLILKADYFVKHGAIDHATKQQELSLALKKHDLSNVKLVWGNLRTEQIFLLYNYADCFVFPSRAEGWGLPLIEALACGTPCISTSCTGHSEFLQAVVGKYRPIRHFMVPNRDPEYGTYWPDPSGNQGNWAEADVGSLGEQLRFAKANYPKLQEMGLAASAIIREQFSWEKATDKALAALQKRGMLPSADIRIG